MLSIRGATTINKNTAEEVLSVTRQLLEQVIKANDLDISLITAIFFTCTKDITSAYPARAARDLGITRASLMCFQEMHVDGSLEKCIRLCVFYDKDSKQESAKHVYLNKAAALRPDLIEN
jgi:monofunctional chorismate mutase